jgi:hypothetical protein
LCFRPAGAGKRESAVTANRHLGIYLRDHHAAAQAGLALARRARDSNRDGELGSFLDSLVERIESDLGTLKQAMAAVDITASRVKDSFAIAGERLGRLKPNGRLRGYSPLSRVVELELLVAGIAAKEALWRSLATTAEPRLSSFDFVQLARSAEQQRAETEQRRVDAAARAFAEKGSGTVCRS